MRRCGFKVPLGKLSPSDRREMRNFQRFMRLWPHHGFDMIQRPRWQKYLGFTAAEVDAINAATLKKAGL